MLRGIRAQGLEIDVDVCPPFSTNSPRAGCESREVQHAARTLEPEEAGVEGVRTSCWMMEEALPCIIGGGDVRGGDKQRKTKQN